MTAYPPAWPIRWLRCVLFHEGNTHTEWVIKERGRLTTSHVVVHECGACGRPRKARPAVAS